MITKEEAIVKVSELVKRFEEQYDSYRKAEYNETMTRRDFIDPFFKALGWDMDNEQGYAEAYREVIHEDRLKIGTSNRAPDYSFSLAGGKRLFYVEAKKPGVSVKDEIQPAYQVRRYGWSAMLSVSIITDFEEFAIYDCKVKPNPTDKASVARIGYLTFRDYINKFDFLWDTFSKEKVLKGSFDKFVRSDANKRGTATVDKEFLQSLDRWRTYLATSISWNNKDLDEDEINFAVQQTIDRIIFLRIAEDRSVEPYGNLKHALKQGEYYQNLFEQFREADDKYNSGLFDFSKDRICANLKIENKIIKTLINELYYPECPYEFSVLSVEILGSAYEQFLGKVIRITPAHHAKIEEKPEVRKAGGVYYTPQYIVEYIVKNTVGKLVEGKNPADVEKIKIVDPACGSGSFLIGAYQYLLDWHKNYYTSANNLTPSPSPGRRGVKSNVLTPDGYLTTAEKKRILLNNIYGVDIDVNAVEVTKLSLLLKCLEGETEASIRQQLSLWNERVLPTLENNIKSGNSLIDTDFYSAELDFGLEKKIKPFNWKNAFPKVFKQGGFDAVIGNPPYIRIQSLAENSPGQIDYFTRKFKSASKGNYDIYVIFIEQALNIANPLGRIGFILPHKFFTAQYGVGIRHVLLLKNAIKEIIHFGHQQVFDNATTYTCILTLANQNNNTDFNFLSVDDLNGWRKSETNTCSKVSFSNLSNDSWSFIEGKDQELFNKLSSIDTKLENVTNRIFQGLKTGADKVFILVKKHESINQDRVFSPQLNKEILLESDLLHKLIKGGNSKRFFITDSELLVLFPYVKSPAGRVTLIQETNLKEQYPLTYSYLKEVKALLRSRDNGKMDSPTWYGYSRNQALDVISTPKIFTPDLSPDASFSIDFSGEIFFTGGVAGGYGIKVKEDVSEKYILGLLNSSLLGWYLKKISTQMRGGWYSFESKYIKHLPIKIIDVKDKYQLSLKNEIVNLVDQLLNLNEVIKETKLQTQIDQIKSRIDYCENRINEIVYHLYGLTEEEVSIVEGRSDS
jgi:type I restriction-modification system DNA methylase subunit